MAAIILNIAASSGAARSEAAGVPTVADGRSGRIERRLRATRSAARLGYRRRLEELNETPSVRMASAVASRLSAGTSSPGRPSI